MDKQELVSRIAEFRRNGDHTVLARNIERELRKMESTDRDEIFRTTVIPILNELRSQWLFRILRKFMRPAYMRDLVVALSREDDPSYQGKYVEIMLSVEDKSAVRELLLSYAQDTNPRVRANALSSLYWIDLDDDTIRRLILFFNLEKDSRALRSIASLLSGIDTKKYGQFKDELKKIFNQLLASDDEYLKNRANIFFGKRVKLLPLK